MIRLAVVADNRSDDWCSRLAARFADVTIERWAVAAPATASDFGQAITETLSRFDAVWISSSKRAVQIFLAAAQAGKHLIVDSRIVLADVNFDALQEAVAAGGGQWLLGNSLRYLPCVQVVKEQLDSGKLGEPGLLRVHRWDAAQEHDQGLAAGTLADELVNEIDLACWFFGGMPTHVYARKHSTRAADQSSNYAQLHLGFPGGGMALLDNWRGAQTGPGYFSLSLIGSSGAAYADDHPNMQLLFHDGPTTALRTEQEHFAAKNQLEDLLAAMREQREPNRSFDHVNQLKHVAAALEESLESDQSVLLSR